MEEATPKKLFVCTCKAKLSYAEALGKFLAEGIPLSSELQDVTIKHVRHCQDLVERGKLWLGGPLPDLSMALNIFVVDSAEEARELQRNDPYSAFGLFYDDKYSEWFIHFPLRKSSPAHREPVEGLLRQAGIEPESL